MRTPSAQETVKGSDMVVPMAKRARSTAAAAGSSQSTAAGAADGLPRCRPLRRQAAHYVRKMLVLPSASILTAVRRPLMKHAVSTPMRSAEMNGSCTGVWP